MTSPPVYKRVLIDQIVLDLRLQHRADKEVDQNTVEHYAYLIDDEEDKLPAPIVFYDGKQYLLASGFHRVAAFALNCISAVRCEVRKGGFDEALRLSFSANGAHGKTMTNADKRELVIDAFKYPEYVEMADRELGRLFGLSPKFIADMRQEIFEPEKPSKRTKPAKSNAQPVDAPKKNGLEIFDPKRAEVPTVITQQEKGDSLGEPDFGDPLATLQEAYNDLERRAAVGFMDATPEEKAQTLEMLEQKDRQISALTAQLQTVAQQRDQYMLEANEMRAEIKRLRNKVDNLKKGK